MITKILSGTRIWKIGHVGKIESMFDNIKPTEENTIASFTPCFSRGNIIYAYAALNAAGKPLIVIYTSGIVVEETYGEV